MRLEGRGEGGVGGRGLLTTIAHVGNCKNIIVFLRRMRVVGE